MKQNLEQTGILWRAADEVRALLDSVRAAGVLIHASVPEGTLNAAIREVGATRLVLECATANDGAALLGRSTTAMHADMPEWHLEFIVTEPRQVEHRGAKAIEVKLPDVVVQHKARAHRRVKVERMALQCLADEAGPMPFTAAIVDLSPEGVGFLVYPPDITLAPGTVLRGCRIDVPLGDPLLVDLEVRYSQPVTHSSGQQAIRSGCRVLDPTRELIELVKKFSA